MTTAKRDGRNSGKNFLLRLKARGLSGVEFASDDHEGPKKEALWLTA